MKLEQQVVSLELAKRLKELGVKQESYAQWHRPKFLEKEGEDDPSKMDELTGFYSSYSDEWSTYSAFTVAELGEILPNHLDLEGKWVVLECRKDSTLEHWYTHYGDRYFTEADTEADARAKMLVHLIENKLIPL